MSRYAYLAFFGGFIGSGIHRGMPVLDIVAGVIFMAVIFYALETAVRIWRGRMVTPGTILDEQEELRRAARQLRNRPGRHSVDNSTMPPPLNKGKRDVKYRRIK